MGDATQFLTWPNSQQFFSLFAPVTLYQARSPPYFACAPVTLPTEPHAKPQAPRTSPARDHIKPFICGMTRPKRIDLGNFENYKYRI